MVAPPSQAVGGSLPVPSMGVLGYPAAGTWSTAPPAPGTPTPGSPAPGTWVRGHMLGGGSQVVYLAPANQVMNKIRTLKGITIGSLKILQKFRQN